jgi:hypothetical protein
LRIADAIAVFGLFSYLFGYVTGWKNYVPDPDHRLYLSAWWEGITSFFSANGAVPVLGAAAVLVYMLGRYFARYSVEILPSLFTDSRTPTAIRIDTPLGVILKTYGQLLLLVGMVLSCNYLWFFCPLLMVLHGYYWWFDTAQRDHMGRFFHDERYAPEETHPHRQFIPQRRQQVQGYLSRHHRIREGVVICFAAAALALYFAAPPSLGNPTFVAYMLIISGMCLNEAIVWTWRWHLQSNVREIGAKQLQDDIGRGL